MTPETATETPETAPTALLPLVFQVITADHRGNIYPVLKIGSILGDFVFVMEPGQAIAVGQALQAAGADSGSKLAVVRHPLR